MRSSPFSLVPTGYKTQRPASQPEQSKCYTRHWNLGAFHRGGSIWTKPSKSSELPGNTVHILLRPASHLNSSSWPWSCCNQQFPGEWHLLGVCLITLTGCLIHKINLLACQHYPSSTWMCCVSGYRIRLTGCLKAGFVKPWLFSVSQTRHLPGSLLQHSLPTMLLRRWHHSCALLSAPVLVSPLWR